ncbi:MAG: class I SAM-dependent methyltransferase [Rhodospirillales bacterium]
MTQTPAKSDVQAFWGALYDSLYEDVDRDLTREALFAAIDDLEDMFALRGHMAAVEMPPESLAGKRVLEIGPGAGGHSALFAKHGAVMTSIDLTAARARSTQAKFALMGGAALGCAALQGDAERLPFADDSFDIVYSNGVLHHTPDTEKAVAEARRVLKPGGRAVIMLYCKSSWHYWFNLWFCEGLLRGRLFTGPHWAGRATEWGGKNAQTALNPITRCYTARGMRRLFHGFENLSLRKGEFYFYLIPKIGRLYRRWQIKNLGVHPGGVLVYGEPWPMQSKLEIRLGRRIGFAWFAAMTKPGG